MSTSLPLSLKTSSPETRYAKHGLGYFPAKLGQTFSDERYVILRKLGSGASSNVWLGYDTRSKVYVSLKILTASSSKELGFHEEEILRRIQNGPSHPGRCYLPEFLDSFVTESPHGKHKVLVTKVSGTSLSSVRDDAAMFTSLPTAPVKQWIREMLLALDYLHTHIRIIHSDFRLENVLLQLTRSTEEFLVQDSPPATSGNGAVTTFEFPVPDGLLTPNELAVPSIRLIDFSRANWIDNHFYPICQPEFNRAPEVFLGHSWGTACDIWALACAAFELWSGEFMFSPQLEEPRTEYVFLIQMINLSGNSFTPDFLAKCANRDEYFDQQGNLKRLFTHLKFFQNLEHQFNAFKLPKDEIPLAADFFRRCIQLDPDERATAAELLKHSWLKI